MAAAADLRFALAEVIEEFGRRHPDIRVVPSYGSSGQFFAQITNKAPFDLYLSADIEYPERIIEAGLAEPDSLFLYAIGQIVVWVPERSSIDPERQGIEALTDPSVRTIAIANPLHAPYGRAAVAAMRSLGVYDLVADRLVMGENVAQTAQFVESGAADIGIIALSLALAPTMRDRGRHWVIPLDAHPPLRQGGVLLKRSGEHGAATLLKDFLAGDSGRAILARYGFLIPEE